MSRLTEAVTGWFGRLRLRTRLLIGGLLLQVLALGLMAGGALALVDQYLQRETRHLVEQLGPFMNAALATPMAQRDYASVAAILEESRQARGFESIIVLDPMGRTIARVGEPGSSGPRRIESEIQLELSGQPLGRVQVGLSLEPLAQTRSDAAQIIAITGLIVLALSSGLLIWLDRMLTRPLRVLEGAARDIHAGNYSISLPLERQDDMGTLMRAFDRMRQEIERKVSELLHSEALQRRYLAESVTEQARTAQALQAAEQANRVKAEFIANMSHEIRTPMNAIIGLTDLAMEETSPLQQREYLMLARVSADNLLAIINDILDFARIDSGRIAVQAQALSVRALVQGIAGPHQASARAKGIALDVRIATDVPASVNADALRVGQILNNLLANAVKFTERGQVGLSVQAEVSGPIAQLEFRVQDSGIGIAPDKLEDIFEPFEQGDNSITRRFGGTGLGLSISRKLAVAMGGSLTVESVPGQGSLFTLTLPVTISRPEDLQHAASLPALESLAPQQGLCVLLVEDNPVNQLLAKTLLEQTGHSVRVAGNGRDGISRWRQGGVDAILMDIQMPVMDGLSATRELRQIEREQGLARTPVIAITANAMSGDREQCIAAGMDDYIAKPFRRSELRAALNRVRPRAGA